METLNDLMQARLNKLNILREAGVDVYPYEFSRTHRTNQIIDNFDELKENEAEVTIAGRLVAKRVMGKASFAHMLDEKGRIQIYVKRDTIGVDNYQLFKQGTDLGDWLGIRGKLMLTKTGEKTIEVLEWTFLAKSIRPLPIVKEEAGSGERHDEMTDPDERYRRRAMDLVVNPDVRDLFRKRAQIIRYVRDYLDKEDYLEVETPVLQPLYGGGTARPFETFHNQLKKKLYMRIADELYLKRLIVGGLDRVYEISKDFRNEGVDRTHNPEFTMMECYIAFEDYNYYMDLVEKMVSGLAQELLGKMEIEWEGKTYDLTPPWPRVKFFDALKEAVGEDLIDADLAKVKEVAKKHHIELPEGASLGKGLDELFGELVEPTFERATFVVDYPLALSPLAKKHRQDKRLVERFEGFLGGMEICNSFSELNDPADQRERFEAQVKAREEGDDEAMQLDEDFIMSLEWGMPPTAGLGMGIDRLVMLLTGSPSIRDVILFPLLRDRQAASEEEDGAEK